MPYSNLVNYVVCANHRLMLSETLYDDYGDIVLIRSIFELLIFFREFILQIREVFSREHYLAFCPII